MPAEWEPHARTYMAWTGDQMVATRLETAVKVDYGLVAKEIARFEPLTVVVEPGFTADAAAYCPGAEILEHSLEDSYLRDSGPLFARKADGTLAAVDFLFNGWGAGEPLGTVGEGDRGPRRTRSTNPSRWCSRAARSPRTARAR